MRTWMLRFRAGDMQDFEQVRAGLKRVETRAATPKYQAVQQGDTLLFVCGTKRLKKRVSRVTRFKSIPAMVKAIPMRSIMPSVHSVQEMRKAYHGYPGYDAKIRRHGLVAWHIK